MVFWKRNKKEKITKPVASEKTKAVVEALSRKSVPQDKTGQAARVVIHPVLTEKGTMLEKNGQYLFNVKKQTTKPEIKKALKQLYSVDIVAVNVLNMRGKKVRFGRTTGVQKNWKKAIITLKAGQRIEVYKK